MSFVYYFHEICLDLWTAAVLCAFSFFLVVKFIPLNFFINKMRTSRGQEQIQAEIRQRMQAEPVSFNDIDFYVRKVRRLENDNNIIQDQLNKVRVRLRRAEDFEIKFDLLTAETNTLRKDLEQRDKAIRDFKTLNEKLTFAVSERSNKQEEWMQEKRGLLEEVEKWTAKAEEAEVRRVTEIATERARSDEAIRREVALARKDQEQKEQELKFEVRQLKKVLHEKEAFEAIISNRVEKVRKEKDEEIARLGRVIEDEKESRATAIDDKNEQIAKLKEKFQKMINFELQNVKKNLQDQGQVFSIELNGLKEIIAIKNDQITKLLAEIKRQAIDHGNDRQQLQVEISLLKDKIYQVEREGELQLFSLKQKLLEIHAGQIRDLEARYEQLLETLRADKADLQGYLRQKDRVREQERKDHERNIHQLQDKIKERDQRITGLLDRIKQSGDINTGELKTLHESFHKIELEKQGLTSEYQTNITFMTQQIAKLTTANEVKNGELKKLFEELHETKIKFQEEIREIDSRFKQERKGWEQERQRDRLERERLLENMAAQERNFQNKERQLLREKEKEQREKNKLKFIVEQLQRDVQRLNKYIKSLDENLKNEYKRSQMNILEGDSSRREITSQLNKQRVEIETLRNIEIDQIKRQFEMETTRITQQNQKLKTDLLNRSLALEKAEAEVKRLDYQHRNMEKINKEKLLDYQKKMATLNSEINLTQQLYQTFMETKARKKQ